MTVFKAFWKVVLKYKFLIILYTGILIVFSASNMQTSDTSMNFVATKPDVLIINNDEKIGITENLINYIEDKCNIVKVKDDDEAINDALFYREISYIIYIPENYRQDFLNGLNPEIQIKSTGDGESSFANMMLERYIKVANIYGKSIDDEEQLIQKINDTLKEEANIEVSSKIDTDNLSKAAFYYNFLNYSIIAGLVYVICLILFSFREEKISKRIIISSMNYKKYNRQLLLSNALLAIILWILYVILSFVLVGEVMFTMHGLVFIVNSFVFSICALCIAFLIANLISNKNAISGIINVVGLGSSFLCGAFVPIEWLPDVVLKVAHVLPSYWYIQTNEIMKTIETVNMESLKPALINMVIVIGFTILYVILANIVSKRKRKIG